MPAGAAHTAAVSWRPRPTGSASLQSAHHCTVGSSGQPILPLPHTDPTAFLAVQLIVQLLCGQSRDTSEVDTSHTDRHTDSGTAMSTHRRPVTSHTGQTADVTSPSAVVAVTRHVTVCDVACGGGRVCVSERPVAPCSVCCEGLTGQRRGARRPLTYRGHGDRWYGAGHHCPGPGPPPSGRSARPGWCLPCSEGTATAAPDTTSPVCNRAEQQSRHTQTQRHQPAGRTSQCQCVSISVSVCWCQ